MDVSYSAWRRSAEEMSTLGVENFSFLFDRRYSNRLNRMSKIFFEAYVSAAKEAAAHEDRFPTLSEIDAKMESGAVYAFKDRLIKNTEFFEEVKISWVIYLVPRAKSFADASGTYAELSFNFEEGTVVLPARRKAQAQAEAALPETEKSGLLQKGEVSIEAVKESLDQLDTSADTKQDIGHPQSAPESNANAAGDAAQGIAGEANSSSIGRPSLKAAMPISEIEALRLMGEGIDPGGKIKIAALGLTALIIVVAAALYIFGSKMVYYSLFLSDANQGDFLDLNITNHDGFDDEIEMVLPPNIFRSMISRGGVITISSDGNTSVRLSASSDASVRLYLSSHWTAIPVTLILTVPKGEVSELKFIRGDYNVKDKDGRIILSFICTREGFSFDQRIKRWF